MVRQSASAASIQRLFLLPSDVTGRVLRGIAAVVALALAVSWIARPTLSIEINPERMQPIAGQAYSAGPVFAGRLLFVVPADSLRHKTRSGLVLFEDGVPLGPAHAGHPQIREKGHGAFSHRNADLLFSSSDGTDPRGNGRHYTARATSEPNPLVFWPGLVLIAAAASGALWLRHGACLRPRLAHALRNCRERLEGQAGANFAAARTPSSLFGMWATMWPFLPIALVAGCAVAPSVSIDSNVIAAEHLLAAVPHYPALYPIFVRSMSAMASLMDWAAGRAAPHLGIVDPAPFTPLAATLTLLAQHALTLASASYLANRLRPGRHGRLDRHGRSDRLGRRLIVAALYLNPFTLQMVHGVTSEALVIPAAYAASAEAFVILTRPWRPWRHYAAFLAWVLLAALARHPAILLGAVVPAGLALQAVRALVRRNRARLRGSLTALGLVCAGLAGVQAAGMLINAAILLYMHVEPRSVPGRAFTYRLTAALAGSSLLPGLDAARFERAVERLKATAGDAELRSDIDVIARSSTPWVEPFNIVFRHVQEACPDCTVGQTVTETDRRLNRVMAHTLLSLDPDFGRDTFLRTINFLAPYLMERYSFQVFGSDVAPSEKFKPVHGFLWKSLDIEPALSGCATLLRDFLFSAACGLVLLTLLGRRGRRLGSLNLGLLGTAAVYSVLVSLVTVYIPRYGLFVDQLALVALVIAIMARADPDARSRECLAEGIRRRS